MYSERACVPNLSALPLAEQIGREQLDHYLNAVEARGPLHENSEATHYNELAWGHLEAGLAVAAEASDDTSAKSSLRAVKDHFAVASDFASAALEHRDCNGNVFVHAAQLKINLPLFDALCSGRQVSEEIFTEVDIKTVELFTAVRSHGVFEGKAVPDFPVAHERVGAVMRLGTQLLCASNDEAWYPASQRERLSGTGEPHTNHDFYRICDGEKQPVRGSFKLRKCDERVSLILFRPLVMFALRELRIAEDGELISTKTSHEYTDVVLDALVNDVRGDKLTTFQRDLLDTVADMAQETLDARR